MNNYIQFKDDIVFNLFQHKEKCNDRRVRLKDLTRCDSDTYKYVITYNGECEFTKYADTQLLAVLKIPAAYLHRCSSILQKVNVDYWINKTKDKELLLRFYDEKVRGVFGKNYNTAWDDIVLYPTVLSAFEETYGKEKAVDEIALYFSQSPESSELQIQNKNSSITYDNNTITSGIIVSNSEIGLLSINIRPYISINKDIRLIGNNKNLTYKVKHMGTVRRETIIETINKILEVGDLGIYQLLKNGKEIIDNPIQEINTFFAQGDFLSKEMEKIVLDEYENIVQAEKLQMITSILKACSSLPLFQKIKLEQMAGNYLGIYENNESDIAEIKAFNFNLD